MAAMGWPPSRWPAWVAGTEGGIMDSGSPRPPDVVVPPTRIPPIRWRGKVLEGRWRGRLPVVAELELRFVPGVRCKLRPKRPCTLRVRMEENWLGTDGVAVLREALRRMRTGECADCRAPLAPNPSALCKPVLCVCCRKPKCTDCTDEVRVSLRASAGDYLFVGKKFWGWRGMVSSRFSKWIPLALGPRQVESTPRGPKRVRGPKVYLCEDRSCRDMLGTVQALNFGTWKFEADNEADKLRQSSE